MVEERRKQKGTQKRGREIKKGSLANELLKDNLHMSGKIKRGREESARRMKSAGVVTRTWGGDRKLIPPATWRRGEGGGWVHPLESS